MIYGNLILWTQHNSRPSSRRKASHGIRKTHKRHPRNLPPLWSRAPRRHERHDQMAGRARGASDDPLRSPYTPRKHNPRSALLDRDRAPQLNHQRTDPPCQPRHHNGLARARQGLLTHDPARHMRPGFSSTTLDKTRQKRKVQIATQHRKREVVTP